MEIVIEESIFSRNNASNYLGTGGAMRLQGQGINVNILNSVSFALNVAELDGGALYFADGLQAVISDTIFVGNEVYRGGGPALFAVVRFRSFCSWNEFETFRVFKDSIRS